jgi:Cys-tRNA(Pro) deacylase
MSEELLKQLTSRRRGAIARIGKEQMDLAEYLKNAGVWHRFRDKPETVHTADASRATGIELSRITKNLVCKTADGRYALLVVPGNRRVSLQRAAQALNTRNIQLLGFNEAEAVSGYPPGGTPSIHHKTTMSVVIEKDLLSSETMFCGGGSRDRILELRTQDVFRLTNAVAADISEK